MADAQLTSIMADYQSFFDQLDPRIKPIKVSKEQFEERNYHIITFSTRLLKKNEDLGLVISRLVVEFCWGLAVWHVYPTADPEKTRLIGQAQSPLFDIFWRKRNDMEAFEAKRIRQRESSAGFWPFPRYLTREEVKRDRGMLIMGNLVWEYIIPEIALLPLYHVQFLVLAKKIMDLNPERSLNIEMMRRLWRMLMKEVYDFAQESERTAKLLEADAVTDDEFKGMAGSVPGPLSKKRETAPINDSDNEESERRGHRSKRKKTVRFEEPKAVDGQITSECNVELSARPHHPTELNSQQPTFEPDRSALNQELLDKTKRIAALETTLKDTSRELAAAHGLATTAEWGRSRATQRLKSQNGRLGAAELRIRELTEANKQGREDWEARRALEHKLNSLTGQFRRATQMEHVLRAEKIRLEALLVKAGVDTGGKS